MNAFGYTSCCLLLSVTLTGIGCSKSAAPSQDLGRFQAIAVQYGRYIGAHRGKPPVNEAELRKFIETQSGGDYQQYGAASLDELLTSPRDSQPMTFVYAFAGPADADTIVAYEAIGVGGKRIALTALGGVTELEEETLQARLK